MSLFQKGLTSQAALGRFKHRTHWGTTINLANYRVYDSFTRSDSASTLGTPTEKGPAWNPVVGTWGITSGKAYAVAPSGSDKAVVSTTVVPSVITGTCATDAIDTHSTGLVVRYVDTLNYSTVTFFAGTLALNTIVAGAFTSVATVIPATVGLPTSGAVSVNLIVTITSNQVRVQANAYDTGAGWYTYTAGEITAFGSGTSAGIVTSWVSGVATAATIDTFTAN